MSECDVIVLGGGLAGHCAMLAAAEAGASVLLIEKCDHVGGSTVLSGGFMAFADTPKQRELGVRDTPDMLLADLRTVGGPYTRDDLLTTYVAEQKDLYQWLASKGVVFHEVELSAGQSAARSHATDPGLTIETMNAAARVLPNVRMRSGTTAVCLIRAGESGPVEGVTVEESGRLDDIRCRGGVVIATGGFSRSEELLRTFVPQQSRALRVGGEGNTGDGLRMAWRLGADFRDMGEVKGTFGAHATDCNNGQEIMLLFYRGAIIVNRSGRRFVDESVSYKLIGDACLMQDEPVSWQVLDKKIFDAAAGTARLFDPVPSLNRGLLVQADSLRSLAERCGIEADAFERTVGLYNADCGRGSDSEFGRDGLCHHVGALIPIDAPPFYAYPSTTAVLATYCGLAVDPMTRVIDVYEEPIAGLYAAGEVIGGFHGHAYMTGTSLGKAALFGRIAGRQAAGRALALGSGR